MSAFIVSRPRDGGQSIKIYSYISKSGEIVDLGTQFGILNKSGAWYGYGDGKIAQGREGAKQFMLDNLEVAEEIEAKIRAKLTGQTETPENNTTFESTKTIDI